VNALTESMPFMLTVSIELFMKMLKNSGMCAGSTPRSMRTMKGLSSCGGPKEAEVEDKAPLDVRV
jgi:hypothetical protein